MELVNQRKHNRIPVRMQAALTGAGADTPGFVTNLSEGGLCVLTAVELADGTELNVDLHPEGRRMVKVTGLQLWSRPFALERTALDLREMGVRLIHPPAEYLDLVAEIARSFIDRRIHPRFRAVLRVKAEKLLSNADLFTIDISKGGMFIHSEKLPPRDSLVELVVSLGEGSADVARLEGMVIDTCDASQARRENRAPGFSLKYMRFREGDDLKLFLYIDQLQRKREYK